MSDISCYLVVYSGRTRLYEEETLLMSLGFKPQDYLTDSCRYPHLVIRVRHGEKTFYYYSSAKPENMIPKQSVGLAALLINLGIDEDTVIQSCREK